MVFKIPINAVHPIGCFSHGKESITKLDGGVLRAGAGQTFVLSEGVNYLGRFTSLPAQSSADALIIPL